MKTETQKQARLLRQKGYSVKEIALQLNVSQSSASLWVRGEKLSSEARARIENNSIVGRKNASHVLIEKRKQRQSESRERAFKLFNLERKHKLSKYMLCSMIYECEGGKGEFSSLEFTNSDPLLVKVFLSLLRDVFMLDESKFRVVMHLHSYHDEKIERKFWSETTQIPVSQFLKTYQKKESGIRKKPNYKGCVQIKYFDVNIKRILLEGKNLLVKNLGL